MLQLMSLVSCALLYTTSITSNLAKSSHMSLSTTQLDKGGSTYLLGGIVLNVSHTQSKISISFVSPPLPTICKKKFISDTTWCKPPYLLRVARPPIQDIRFWSQVTL
jgi:hypothetical protein